MKNKDMIRQSVLRVVLLFVASLATQAAMAQLESEKTEQGIWVQEKNEKVLFYQAKTKSMDDKYARANYVHPLYNVDGYELTEDFPEDHLHHRGIFWTWHQTIIDGKPIGDAWECKDFSWDVVQYDAVKSNGNSLRINTKTYWKSPLWKSDSGEEKPFLEERAIITVHEKVEDYRVIDFEISLLALENNLQIAGSDDHKGYGGFSPRIKMPENVKFESEGKEVKPKTEQVAAGPWMNMSGSLASNNGHGGVIMICHPDNPGYPEKWILRSKRSMQNPVYPGRQPVMVSTKDPTVLKYRLVVYTGKFKQGLADQLSSW